MGEGDPLRRVGRLEDAGAVELLAAVRAVDDARAPLERGLDGGRIGDPQAHDQCRGARNCKQAVAELVRTAGRDDQSDEQRTNDRAGLVDRLMQAERSADSDDRGCVRQHRVAARCSDCLAETFAVVERRGRCEAAGDTHERDADQREGIADDRLRPWLAGAVGERAGDETQHQRHSFADARDDTDHGRRRAEGREVGTDDTAPALVDDVAERRDHAGPGDKADGADARWHSRMMSISNFL